MKCSNKKSCGNCLQHVRMKKAASPWFTVSAQQPALLRCLAAALCVKVLAEASQLFWNPCDCDSTTACERYAELKEPSLKPGNPTPQRRLWFLMSKINIVLVHVTRICWLCLCEWPPGVSQASQTNEAWKPINSATDYGPKYICVCVCMFIFRGKVIIDKYVHFVVFMLFSTHMQKANCVQAYSIYCKCSQFHLLNECIWFSFHTTDMVRTTWHTVPLIDKGLQQPMLQRKTNHFCLSRTWRGLICWQCGSVDGRVLCLTLGPLLDGSPRNFVQTFVVLSTWTLTTLVIP